MSTWRMVEDIDDIAVSHDKKTLEILIGSDDWGNNYIEVPIEFIAKRLNDEVDKLIQELKEKAENQNSILFGINGHKILVLMELKERLGSPKTPIDNKR